MSGEWYDTAQICINGHVINSQSVSRPDHNSDFCDKCGAPTIIKCQKCNKPIRGIYHSPYHLIPSDVTSFTLPSFCPECGKTYLWTEAKLKAAQDLSDELDNLSKEEREMLKKSIDDIVRDTPQTTVAVTRFKRLVAKAGKPAADAFRDILVDILSEAIKKSIWPS
jgi:hypothetical protein